MNFFSYLRHRFPAVGREEVIRALAVLAKEGRAYLAEIHPQPESKTGGMYGDGKKTTVSFTIPKTKGVGREL